MHSVLFVHQGIEKYGSDRSFASTVAALHRETDLEIHILLPGRGPILELLSDTLLNRVSYRNLWVLRKTGLLWSFTFGLPLNLWAVVLAVRDLIRFDLVYINTSVILDFLLASILVRRRCIIHVREIPTGPLRFLLRFLLIISPAEVFFNSYSTRTAFSLPSKKPQAVIYNGIARPPAFRKERVNAHKKINVLCIGRINGWKGQDVLIDAIALLPAELQQRIDVRIVGDVFGKQVKYRRDLERKIEENRLEAIVNIAGFVNDPDKEYLATDIVIVPSIKPEPFGRVAIEGMAYACPIIAANHGGLTEIVQHQTTGMLIEPNNPVELSKAIEQYLLSPSLVAIHGQAGAESFSERFTQEASDRSLLEAFRGFAARNGAKSGTIPSSTPRRITCIHQGSELYGSDRSFLSSVASLKRSGQFLPIIIVPRDGPLCRLMREEGIGTIQVRPLLVLRKAGLASNMTIKLGTNVKALFASLRLLKSNDAVYVNTAVVLDVLLASILTRRKVIVHVHEIPVGFALVVIRALLVAAGPDVIFNSLATKKAFALPARQRQAIVYNGYSLPTLPKGTPIKDSSRLQLLCIGRMNSWKGQSFLIRALGLLTPLQRDQVFLTIMGGVFSGQEHYRTAIENEITASGVDALVKIVDFDPDPSGAYEAADVVVVPSTLPEPFGRVAIEGMAHGCAIIATNHGGLPEIVVDGKTGILVPPRDPNSLAHAITTYLDDPAILSVHAKAGRMRFKERFSQASSDLAFVKAIEDFVDEG